MRLNVESCRMLAGFAGGLAERTALVDVAVEGAPEREPAAEARLRAGAVAFCPDQHLYDIGESDWPAGFLVPKPADSGPTRWLGEWVVALTVAAQRWGHDPVFRGRVVAADPDRLRLAIPWHREQPFRDGLEMALQLVAVWATPEPDRAALRKIDRAFRGRLPEVYAGGLNVDSLRFAETAARQGIPFDADGGMVRYGWGVGAEYLDGTATGDTGVLAAALARNKALANRRLTAAGVPVPRCRVAATPAQARDAAAELGWPVVVKPPNRDSGMGVEPGIRDYARLDRACTVAGNLGGGRVLVEEHIDGLCYRLLVVHGRMLAAVRRVPAGVIGDGEHTVADLVDAANAEPRRGTVIGRLVLDGSTLQYLAEQGAGLDTVPEPGRRIYLQRTAYSETGGHHEDVTALVHPDNRALAERVARLVGLDIAGVDLLTTDITRSWQEVGGAVCEVNAQPSLMPHWIAEPHRDINSEVLDIVFGGRSPRIPTAAVTGTGAATVAALLHRIWGAAGRRTGLCNTDGVRIGDAVIAHAGTGLSGVRIVLAEPDVAAAVFEIPAGEVIADGHGCDRYDVVGVLDGPEPCPEILERAGIAVVIGVADPWPAAVRRIVIGHEPVDGAEAVYPDGLDIVLPDGGRVPVADTGTPVLFAAAMAWAQGVDVAVIRAALASPDRPPAAGRGAGAPVIRETADDCG